MLEIWKDDPVKCGILMWETAKVYADLGKHFLRIGDYHEARRCLRLALSYDPWSWKNWRRFVVSYVPGVRHWYTARKVAQTTR